jgi:predicted nucleotidyltransferase
MMSYLRKKLRLPPRLLQNLQKLAEKYKADGLDIFIFGSFARGDQRPTSDLDVGVEWRKERNPQTFLRLYWEMQALPTIRKIELVDFSQTDPNFRRIAGANKIYLSEKEPLQNENKIA